MISVQFNFVKQLITHGQFQTRRRIKMVTKYNELFLICGAIIVYTFYEAIERTTQKRINFVRRQLYQIV